MRKMTQQERQRVEDQVPDFAGAVKDSKQEAAGILLMLDAFGGEPELLHDCIWYAYEAGVEMRFVPGSQEAGKRPAAHAEAGAALYLLIDMNAGEGFDEGKAQIDMPAASSGQPIKLIYGQVVGKKGDQAAGKELAKKISSYAGDKYPDISAKSIKIAFCTE